MRPARAGDYWRGVYKRDFPTRLSQLEYESVLGVGDGHLTFDGGITVLCGANGVGKSTLLEVAVAGLNLHRATDPSSFRRRLANARVRVDAHADGEPIQREVIFGGEGTCEEYLPVEICAIDTARQSPALIDWASSESNLEELLEGLEPRSLETGPTRILSYLVGKDYSSVRVFEIDEFEERGVFPYFIVEEAGATYGSEAMGLGEMALFLTWWSFDRMKEATVVLVEEPESYISPRSQRALMDVIAMSATKKALWTIVTTHSPAVVSVVPRAHLLLVTRQAGNVGIGRQPTDAQLNRAVGLQVALQVLVFLEDAVACAFLDALVRERLGGHPKAAIDRHLKSGHRRVARDV